MKNSITKADIINAIAKSTGITKADTKVVVEGVIAEIIDAVVKGYKVEIRGFGVFQSKKRKARTARNPKTGELIAIGEKIIPLFKISDEFTKKLNVECITECEISTTKQKKY